MKEQCYAFDFAPDRTLRVLAETAKVSAKAGKQTEEDRKILGDFLNFCPIISIDGSQMKPYDVNKMMGQLKKAQIEKVVQCGFEDGALYNDELLKLTDVELRDFDELKKTIGQTKAMAKSGDIDVNNQGFTDEQYEEKEKLEKKPKKERTPEEQARLDELKAMSNQRRNAISILRGISIRMPLLIYGAELKSEDEEITIDNFASLIDDQSWEEFMPKGVDKERFEKFKKYYDPDIFREAGKRIREMARAADKFTIEERIERISAIFNTFRNPDKETVLTPWRVVNMHMSDCLGGWCFYDEAFQQPLSVPRYVDQGKVTRDVFRPDAHILEINSKSGLYPLYVAYNIYRARVESMKQKYGELGHAFAQNLWDATIEENILVVCKTPMAKSITKRTLAGFRNIRVNAQYYKDLIQNISERPEAVVNTFRDGKHFWKINQDTNMKLDAIVGNPPYQVMDGGGNGAAATPIYNKFVGLSKRLKPHFSSMIIPARWYGGGRGLDEFRLEMLQDKHFAYIKDFPNPKDCFPTANISGGVCYFRWELSNVFPLCEFVNSVNGMEISAMRELSEFDMFIRYNKALSIIHKIQKFKEESLSEIVSQYMPFGIRSYERGRERRESNKDLLLHSSRGTGYISKNMVTASFDYIDKYNVITGKAISGHLGETDENGQVKLLATTKVIAPLEIATESYLAIGKFDNQEEAKNLLSYMKTKFMRFLLLQGLTSMNITKDRFLFVPLQDFTRPWTDADLYAKYHLTDEEIQFIESMIKPMD